MASIELDTLETELKNCTIGGQLCYESLQDFNIEKQIGKGQFSVVHRASCKRDGSLVALKTVKIYEMLNNKTRFDCIKEITLLQQVDHPNIIKYIASFLADGELYVVLELADAGDLSKMIEHFRKQKRLINERTIWKYFVQVCNALEHMHSNRIMHRDIKPANVFVTSQGIVKLGDLGFGRFFSSKTVAAHSLVGTPYYMAPESLLDDGYNFKSDIWSLGCLLYELAALQSPFYAPHLKFSALRKRIEKCVYAPIPSNYYSLQIHSLVGACITADARQRPGISEVCAVARDMHQKHSDNSAARTAVSPNK